MKFLLTAIALLLYSSNSFAVVKQWQIIADQSKLEFVANQAGSDVKGSFKKFSGEILFDKNALNASKVNIEIDLSSVFTSSSETVETLKSKDWLDIKSFVKATFKSEKFSKISENKFSTTGILTIKNKAVPVKLEFEFKEYSASQAKAVGTATLNRNDFGIGNKDEKLANGVKGVVKVNFEIVAK